MSLSSLTSILARPGCRPGLCCILALALVLAAGATVKPGTACAAGTALQPAGAVESGPARWVGRSALKAAQASDPGPVAHAPKPFRPTMGPTAYQAAKAAAAAPSDSPLAKPGSEPGAYAPTPASPPVVKGIQYDGVAQVPAGNWTPPDPHGAAGKNHFCQVVNSYLKCYQKGLTNQVVYAISLNTFVGYGAQALFDPRIIYDAVWNRWVIAAAAFPESPTLQYLFIAVSKDASPNHGFWIYSVDVAFASDDFWDYSGLGMDQDSIIFTANNFHGDTYIDSRLFTVAKARLYNGLGWSVPIFTGLDGTLQPPIVLDQDAQTYVLAAADNVGGNVTKYSLENTSRAFETTLSSSLIPIGAWNVPPSAGQPNSAVTLDTLDSRFQNASTQSGGMLWQTHTRGVNGWPIPYWFKFDGDADSLDESGYFYVFPGSYDFNPSIAANAGGDIYLNWSMTCPSTNPGLCPNGQLTVRARFAGKQAADVGNNITGNLGAYGNSGANVASSATNPARFGDYSAVSVDPKDDQLAWITNEVLTGPTSWKTRIARIGF